MHWVKQRQPINCKSVIKSTKYTRREKVTATTTRMRSCLCGMFLLFFLLFFLLSWLTSSLRRRFNSQTAYVCWLEYTKQLEDAAGRSRRGIWIALLDSKGIFWCTRQCGWTWFFYCEESYDERHIITLGKIAWKEDLLQKRNQGIFVSYVHHETMIAILMIVWKKERARQVTVSMM